VAERLCLCFRDTLLKLDKSTRQLFYEKLDVLENTLNNCKRRKTTVLGKINFVKSIGLSKLIYNAPVLPVPEDVCYQVNKITLIYWDNSQIKKKTHMLAKAKTGV